MGTDGNSTILNKPARKSLLGLVKWTLAAKGFAVGTMRPLKIPCQSDSVPYTSGETNERNNKPTATSNSKVRL